MRKKLLALFLCAFIAWPSWAAIDLDGSNDYVELGVTNLPGNNAPQSWSLWLNLDAISARTEIMALTNNGLSSSLSLEIPSNVSSTSLESIIVAQLPVR